MRIAIQQTANAVLVFTGMLMLLAGNKPTGAASLPKTDSQSVVNLSSTCPPVENTPAFTIVYGSIQLDDSPAPVGTVVTAKSPRGDTVGCFIVTTAGSYGSMYVYGEDNSINPAIPGMRTGETVTLLINHWDAVESPALIWSNDRDFHQIDISGITPNLVYLPLIIR